MPLVRTRVLPALVLALALLAPARASAQDATERTPRVPQAPHDPLVPLLVRMDRYFDQHEADGVTMDSRYSVSPSEAIRQSVICQLLGYIELYKVRPSAAFRRDIEQHADYLIANLDAIRSYTPFDGMLGYSLIAAWGVTREPRHLAAAQTLLDELEAIPTSQCILNGGLMVAMATAKAWQLMGDAVAGQKTRDILAMLPAYENADGSFPHWCPGSEDIHYTGWMGLELVHIQRTTGDSSITPLLERMHAFLEARIDSTGHTHYEEPCPGSPGCTRYYYSRASGCYYDYDTRGWTVEPGYSSVMFDRFQSPKYLAEMRFLLSIEHRGTFPDLWCCWPPPSDPEYPWTIADTSVANMSIIFWSMATILSGRHDLADAELAWGGEPLYVESPSHRPRPGPQPVRPPGIGLRASVVRPGYGGGTLEFTLPGAADVSLVIFDAGGRRVRSLDGGQLAAGAYRRRWDGRDDAGRALASGLYFARLSAGAGAASARVLLVR